MVYNQESKTDLLSILRQLKDQSKYMGQLLDLEQQIAQKSDLWEMGKEQDEPQDFPSLLTSECV